MQQEQSKKSAGAKWRWVLGASLALNLVFVGLFAGAAWRGTGGGPGGDRSVAEMRGHAAPYILALPKETRRAIGRALKKDDGARRSSRKERRLLYVQMQKLLRAEPFEAAAVSEVLELQKSATLQRQRAAQELWLAKVKAMTPTDRAAYADSIEKILSRRDKRRANPPRD